MIDREQAQQAFGGDPGQILFCEMTHKGYGFLPGRPGWVNLARPVTMADDYWLIEDTQRLRDILERDDLTLRRGRPLIAAPDIHELFVLGLLAVATGPAVAPDPVEISTARFDSERQVLLRTGESQPDWWLIEAWTADPFSGGTDAKRTLAEWRAETDTQAD